MVNFIKRLLGRTSPTSQSKPKSSSSCCTEPTMFDECELSEETLWNTESLSSECQDLLDQAYDFQQEGDFRQSITAYQEAMDCVVEKSQEMALLLANTCYVVSRLYLKLHKPNLALEFAKLELEYTKVARCRPWTIAYTCHELAKLAQYSLGESELALQYHQEALQYAKSERPRRKEVIELIRDIKNCIGRLHFEMGNVDAALGMLH